MKLLPTDGLSSRTPNKVPPAGVIGDGRILQNIFSSTHLQWRCKRVMVTHITGNSNVFQQLIQTNKSNEAPHYWSLVKAMTP